MGAQLRHVPYKCREQLPHLVILRSQSRTYLTLTPHLSLSKLYNQNTFPITLDITTCKTGNMAPKIAIVFVRRPLPLALDIGIREVTS